MTTWIARIAAAPLALTLALVQDSPAQERITFAPPAGHAQVRTLEIKHELEVEKLQRLRDGVTIGEDPTSGWVSTWERGVFTDEFVKSESGRPLALLRSYDEIASGGKASLILSQRQGVEQNSSSESELYKHRVRFTWVPKEQAYSACYEHFDGRESALAGVDCDLDFFGLLPTQAVAVGTSWDIGIEHARRLLAPGGVKALTPKNKKQFSRTMKVGVGSDLADVISDPAGKIVGTFAGRRTVEGVECLVIEIELQVTSIKDRTQIYIDYMPPEEAKDPARVQAMHINLEIQGKGTLLWDATRHHLRSWEFTGREHVRVAIERRQFEGEHAATLGQASSFEGEITVRLDSRDVPPKEVEAPKGQ